MLLRGLTIAGIGLLGFVNAEMAVLQKSGTLAPLPLLIEMLVTSAHADESPSAAESNESGFDLDWPEDIQVDDQAVDVKASRRATQAKKLAKIANKPRISSTAEPDFAGNIREGYQLFDNMRPYIVIP
ncbi:MAG: hypothetical protein GY807_00110, partial [Gammaproteobacteria bacterium]|nr:hypothetical protein [Gammaproteobacteria bacterium]